jgi:deoxyribonuclease-4
MTLILGAHMSIAGGYHRAVERAAAAGCNCLQLFTQNNLRWENRRVFPEEANRFQEALLQYGITHPLVHANYLINLASPHRTLWRRSVRAFTGELRRAEVLGVRWVVVHPGAATDGNRAKGIGRVVKALDAAFDALPSKNKVGCLLETTAGQGNTLGSRLEELAEILDRCSASDRLGICLDTCHLFAAGYPLSPPEEYSNTIKQIELTLGLKWVYALHVNDSAASFGSRIDRHAHIGEGKIGLEAFRLLLNDERVRCLPMYIETPKEARNGEDMDVVNLRRLRTLVDAQRPAVPPKAME